jgi:hypothetical protein
VNWKPVRDGDTYCSSACGGRCTWGAYERACAAGAELAAGLGPLFEPRIWENIGWHYAAHTADRCITIHTHAGSNDYTAYVNADGKGGGRWLGHGTTPRAALREARALLHSEAGLIGGVLDKMDSALSC